MLVYKDYTHLNNINVYISRLKIVEIFIFKELKLYFDTVKF